MESTIKQISPNKIPIHSQNNKTYECELLFSLLLATDSTPDTAGLFLKTVWFDTPLGPMIAIADDNKLYVLEFINRQNIEKELKKLQTDSKALITPGKTKPLIMIQQEVDSYFSGTLQRFTTPLHMIGTNFQKKAWELLCTIPYGQTRSYQEQAQAIGNPKAFRAVANANGKNQLALIVPCHRIINNNGKLGGYGAGLERKAWLLKHENRFIK